MFANYNFVYVYKRLGETVGLLGKTVLCKTELGETVVGKTKRADFTIMIVDIKRSIVVS